MEKTEAVLSVKENNIHHFYCDNCNEHLGSSQEYDDGYYSKIGEFELSIKLPDSWYKVKKCLCDECKRLYLVNLKIKLKDVGFEKD